MNKSNEFEGLNFRMSKGELVIELNNCDDEIMTGVLLAQVGSCIVKMLIEEGLRGTQLIYEAGSYATLLKNARLITPSVNVKPFDTEQCTVEILEKWLQAEAIMQIRTEIVDISRSMSLLEESAKYAQARAC